MDTADQTTYSVSVIQYVIESAGIATAYVYQRRCTCNTKACTLRAPLQVTVGGIASTIVPTIWLRQCHWIALGYAAHSTSLHIHLPLSCMHMCHRNVASSRPQSRAAAPFSTILTSCVKSCGGASKALHKSACSVQVAFRRMRRGCLGNHQDMAHSSCKSKPATFHCVWTSAHES